MQFTATAIYVDEARALGSSPSEARERLEALQKAAARYLRSDLLVIDPAEYLGDDGGSIEGIYAALKDSSDKEDLLEIVRMRLLAREAKKRG